MNTAQYDRLVAARAKGRNPDDHDDRVEPDNPSVNAAMVQAANLALAEAKKLLQEQRAEIDQLRARLAAFEGPHDDAA